MTKKNEKNIYSGCFVLDFVIFLLNFIACGLYSKTKEGSRHFIEFHISLIEEFVLGKNYRNNRGKKQITESGIEE